MIITHRAIVMMRKCMSMTSPAKTAGFTATGKMKNTMAVKTMTDLITSSTRRRTGAAIGKDAGEEDDVERVCCRKRICQSR